MFLQMTFSREKKLQRGREISLRQCPETKDFDVIQIESTEELLGFIDRKIGLKMSFGGRMGQFRDFLKIGPVKTKYVPL